MPAKHAQNLQQTYAKLASAYDQKHRDDLNTEALKNFISQLPPKAHILDLGSGPGRDSTFFVRHGFEVTMLDISKEMIEIAQRNVPSGHIVQTDMTEMSFPNETFDGVWANASFLHLTKDELPSVLSTVFAFLKPGGIIHARVKQGEGETIIEDSKYQQPAQRFFSFYQPSEFKNYFSSAGFTVSKMIEDQTNNHHWVGILAQKPN